MSVGRDLYQRYGPALVRKARRMLQSEADAQDVVQGLFVDLIRKGRLDVTLAYLYQAVTRRCLNLLRDNRRRAELLAQQIDPSQALVTPSVEGQALSRDLLATLARTLNRKLFEVLVYRYIDDMGLDEIAHLMGRSTKTISRWLVQIREAAHAFAH